MFFFPLKLGCEGRSQAFPILGGLLCSPGYPWRTAVLLVCAASEDVGLEGKPHNVAGLLYSRMALEKTRLNITCVMLSQGS